MKIIECVPNFSEGRDLDLIKVYRKIRMGVWVDMGFYDLIDGFTKFDGKRNVSLFRI